MSAVATLGVLTPVLVLVVVFGFVALMRYLRYREHMAMIERGIAPPRPAEAPPASWPQEGRNRLIGGFVTTGVGLALILGLLTLGWGPWIVGGLIPLFAGLATLLSYFLIDYRSKGAGSPPSTQKGGGGAQGAGGAGQ